jgi:hypothetical protein
LCDLSYCRWYMELTVRNLLYLKTPILVWQLTVNVKNVIGEAIVLPKRHLLVVRKNNIYVERTNIIDKRGCNGLGRKLLSSSGPSITPSKPLIFSNCWKLNCKDRGLLHTLWTQLRLVLMVYIYIIFPTKYQRFAGSYWWSTGRQ